MRCDARPLFFVFCLCLNTSYGSHGIKQGPFKNTEIFPSILNGALPSQDDWRLYSDLLFSYVTPRGPGVSEACQNASEAYLEQLNKPISFLPGEDGLTKCLMQVLNFLLWNSTGNLHFPGNLNHV
eukprot:TRINITY_DN32618_c0_g1_i1.p1 TRINITY_DN32618_c0_g1~~TRINITY_DN32618_c0_g1_i1.p1  ORF type:complete len:144 (+),score=25.05 TRINITY_DN32618_c0_g1_i1:58-432(+)